MLVAFGPFRLIPSRRLLLQGDKPVQIGSRALDILIALVERRGALVTKEQLLAAAWPSTNVHEANLRVHIAGIRKLLGEGRGGVRYVVSDAGRGYRFVAPVVEMADSELDGDKSAPRSVSNTVPKALRAKLAPLVGRGLVLETLSSQLTNSRCITIVGPGGIGKTSVALALAESIAGEGRVSVQFLDLAPLVDKSLISSQLAAAFNLDVADHSAETLAEKLKDQDALIIFDNCEHMIEPVAALTETLLRVAPKIMILSTSREPLRALGEFIHRLSPLTCPQQGEKLSADEAMTYSAIQLFVHRARANVENFELSDADVGYVVEICRKLDGLPLAIELAAGRLQAFGLRGLASLLENRLGLPLLGRRTAAPRHRTLASLLDWSYETLPTNERNVLRRLGVFSGQFSLDAASEVAAFDGIEPFEVIESVANLVEKSLISADISRARIAYRLLETTRDYALSKLRESKEYETAARRHASYYAAFLERGAASMEKTLDVWLAKQRGVIDQVRTALDFCFSEAGEVTIGVALTLAAIPLWIHLSLNRECCLRVEKALEFVDGADKQRARMRLLTALAGALIFTRDSVAERATAWQGALEIAEASGDIEFKLRALWGLAGHYLQIGEFRKAAEMARRFAAVTEREGLGADALVAERLLGLSAHFMGNQIEARQRLERMYALYSPDPTHVVRFQFDPRVTARAYLSVILWLQGFPDRALSLIQEYVADCLNGGHGVSLAYALGQSSCIVPLWSGDLDAAERYIDMLSERSGPNGAATLSATVRVYRGMLAFRRGDAAHGIKEAELGIRILPEKTFRWRYALLLCDLAESLTIDGQPERASEHIEKALAMATHSEEFWIMPELLRVKGEIERARGHLEQAEDLFEQSLEWTEKDDVLSWRLRTAVSLCLLRRELGRTTQGYDLLRSVYDRFTEGFATSDLKKALRLLKEIENDMGANDDQRAGASLVP